jgi:hypothetical protein
MPVIYLVKLHQCLNNILHLTLPSNVSALGPTSLNVRDPFKFRPTPFICGITRIDLDIVPSAITLSVKNAKRRNKKGEMWEHVIVSLPVRHGLARNDELVRIQTELRVNTIHGFIRTFVWTYRDKYRTKNKLTPWSESPSELYRPSDRRLSAK